MQANRLKNKADWEFWRNTLIGKICNAPHTDEMNEPSRYPTLVVSQIHCRDGIFQIENLFFYKGELDFLC